MKRIAVSIFLILASCSLLAQPKNASTGLSFLKLGVGARAIGMGEAYSALSADAPGIYYNPAGISFGDANEITIMHKDWVFGTATEYLGAVVHVPKFAFGFGLNSTNVDGIEIRDQPGPSQGTFGSHDLAVSATASYRIDTSLSVGVTGKFLYEKIYVDESSGAAVDVGTRYQFDRNFAVAAAVTNLGHMTAFVNEAPNLPSAFRFGGVFQDGLADPIVLAIAADVIKVFDDNGVRVHLGVEAIYNSFFALRSGYQIGYDAKGFSAGFGVRYGIVHLDYAYVPFLDQLGSTQSFALTFNL